MVLLILLAPISSAYWFEPEPHDSLRIISVGDVMLGRGVRKHIQAKGRFYLFSRVAELLQKGDITMCNLESPVVMTGKPMDKKYIFKADTTVLPALVKAGFNCVSVANNHAFDYGTDAFLKSNDNVQSKGIAVVGGGANLEEALKPQAFIVGRQYVGIMGFNDTKTNFIGKNRPAAAPGADIVSLNAVKKYAPLYDFLIIQIHWGYEYKLLPSERQKTLGRKLIDAGADLVIGHHPHWVQGIELYNGKVIAYSLGNFMFDQNGFMENLSAILEIDYRDGALRDVTVHPIDNLTEFHMPRPVNEAVFDEFYTIFQRASRPLGTELYINDGAIHIKLEHDDGATDDHDKKEAK